MSRRRNPTFRFAQQALRAAADTLGHDTQVGWLKRLGEGMSRSSWKADIITSDGRERTWVAQVPHDNSPHLDRFADELELLRQLSLMELPFRIPQAIGAFEIEDREVNITSLCLGARVDVMEGVLPPEQLARVTAHVAAAVHNIPFDGLTLPGHIYDSRRDDVHAAIEDLDELDASFIDDAIAWCVEHLPDDPPTLMHGDLLGQNVLMLLDGPTSLIDWEYAGIGDPARDLAVVTRGQRKVFRSTRGTRMLLDAYNEVARRPITMAELRVQELGLVAGEVSELPEGSAQRRHELNRLRKLFSVATARR